MYRRPRGVGISFLFVLFEWPPSAYVDKRESCVLYTFLFIVLLATPDTKFMRHRESGEGCRRTQQGRKHDKVSSFETRYAGTAGTWME